MYKNDGLKLYVNQCDLCDKKYSRSNHLKEHKKTVHDGVKYSCDECDYKATSQGNLKIHKRRVHEGVKY